LNTKVRQFTGGLCVLILFLSAVSFAEGPTQTRRRGRWLRVTTLRTMALVGACALALAHWRNEDDATRADSAILSSSIRSLSYPSLTDEQAATREEFLKAMQPVLHRTRVIVVAQGPSGMLEFETRELEATIRQLVKLYPFLAIRYGIKADFTASRDMPQFGVTVPWNPEERGDAFRQRLIYFWMRGKTRNVDNFLVTALGRYYDDHPNMATGGSNAQYQLWRLMEIFPPSAIPADKPARSARD